MADLDTVAKCPTLVRGTTQNSDFLLYPAQNCRSYPQKTTGYYKKPQILVVPGFLRISPCLVASFSSNYPSQESGIWISVQLEDDSSDANRSLSSTSHL